MEDKEIATRVFVYMYERAEFEGVSFQLSPEFFESLVERGMRNFFGFIVSDEGEPLRDEQNPVFFKKFINELNEL